jgi:ribosomal protein L22
MVEEKPKAEVKEQPKAEEKKVEEVKPEVKVDVKKEEKKESPKVVKKDEATAIGKNLHASMKQCKYICKFIKKKSIDEAINYLNEVIKKKKLIPFKGEIPHRHAEGIMSGRYPVNASKLIINVLKGLKGNVLANQMDLDKAKIYYASASWASRPSKKGGGRFKRTNVILKAKEVPIKVDSKTS